MADANSDDGAKSDQSAATHSDNNDATFHYYATSTTTTGMSIASSSRLTSASTSFVFIPLSFNNGYHESHVDVILSLTTISPSLKKVYIT